MKMNKNQEKKQIAYALYINSANLTKKHIASQAGCTEATLSKWISQGSWDKIRESKTITRGELLQDAYAQLKAINQAIKEQYNGIPDKSLSDAKAVIRKEIETLSENPLHIYIEVIEEILAFVGSSAPAQLQPLANLFQSFIQSKQNGKSL